jgi:hypothetical protein
MAMIAAARDTMARSLAAKRHKELLDAALKETFPASDSGSVGSEDPRAPAQRGDTQTS